MGDKKGGDRESSIKTRIINDTYEKDYKTKTFKTNINMYFTKIVFELYKLVEEKNL